MKAIWNDKVVAESKDTVIVENNHYFPESSLNKEYFKPSDKMTHCPWKGDANYYSIEVDGKTNQDAAWYYPTPKSAASELQGRIAFWRGVSVVE